METIKKMLSSWICGLLPPEGLPDLAALILETYDSPSLGLLASWNSRLDASELNEADLLIRGLREAGISLPGKAEALRWVVDGFFKDLAEEEGSSFWISLAAAHDFLDAHQRDLSSMAIYGHAMDLMEMGGRFVYGYTENSTPFPWDAWSPADRAELERLRVDILSLCGRYLNHPPSISGGDAGHVC